MKKMRKCPYCGTENELSRFRCINEGCLSNLPPIDNGEDSKEDDIEYKITTEIVCPKCQKGRLLKMPNQRDIFICEACYIMSNAKDIEKAIKTGYKDERPEAMKAFDAMLKQQDRRSPMYVDIIRRGKRIVQALKQKEKEQKRKR